MLVEKLDAGKLHTSSQSLRVKCSELRDLEDGPAEESWWGFDMHLVADRSKHDSRNQRYHRLEILENPPLRLVA